jgi:hypothetical protein
LWKETPELPWRYQVRCVSTGEEYRFSELGQVLAFLEKAADKEGGLDQAHEKWPGEAGGHPASASSGLDLAYL